MDSNQVRQRLVRFFGEGLTVTERTGYCVVTLPLMTPDGRYVDVYVNETEVHDAGKTASELCAQGLTLSSGDGVTSQYLDRAKLEALAQRYGARFENDVFRRAVDGDQEKAILAVAQCAAVAMHGVLEGDVRSSGKVPVYGFHRMQPASWFFLRPLAPLVRRIRPEWLRRVVINVVLVANTLLVVALAVLASAAAITLVGAAGVTAFRLMVWGGSLVGF